MATDYADAMQLNVQYTLVPDSYPNLPLTGLPYPSEAPPNVTNGICCAQFLDTMTTRQRYIMVVKTLIGEVRDISYTDLLIVQDRLPAMGQTHICREKAYKSWSTGGMTCSTSPARVSTDAWTYYAGLLCKSGLPQHSP